MCPRLRKTLERLMIVLLLFLQKQNLGFLLVRGRGWSRTDAVSADTAAFIEGTMGGGLSGYSAGSSSPRRV